MTWAKNSRFPAAYRDSLYIAYHGSLGVQDPAKYRDCKIERFVIQNGLPVRSETLPPAGEPPGRCAARPGAARWGW